MIPDNLFEATFNQIQTKYNVKVTLEPKMINGTNVNVTVSNREKYLGKMGNPNIIGSISYILVCFSNLSMCFLRHL